MHIEINAGGLSGGIAVATFQNGMKKYISGTDGMISSFKAVKTKTYNLNGGGSGQHLSGAMEDISQRIRTEENRKRGAETVQEKSNSFLDLAVRVDNSVANIVKQDRKELYGQYPGLKPSPGQWVKGHLSTALKWLDKGGEAVFKSVKALTAINNTVQKLWSSIKEFYQKWNRINETLAVSFPGGNHKGLSFITLVWESQRFPLMTTFSIFLLGIAFSDVPLLRQYVETNTDSDTYVIKNAYVFGDDNTYIYDSIKFHEGLPTQPDWHEKRYEDEPNAYDNCFPYDPNAKWSLMDWAEWNGWKFAPFYRFFKNVPDGMATYLHYRSGTGTPVWIDYEKAYREDSVIADDIDVWVAKTNEAIRQMLVQGATPPFSITSDLLPIPIDENSYPVTENWRKAIGGHKIWISADVSIADDGSTIVTTTAHELDRYNFDKDKVDVNSSIPDELNGKFEVYGWARSFDTHGEITFETNLSDDTTTPYIVSKVNGKKRS